MAMAKLNIATGNAGVVTFFARPELIGSTDEEIMSAKNATCPADRIEILATNLRQAFTAFSHVEPLGRG